MQPKLHTVPIKLKEACRFIDRLHRHHAAPRGQLWAIGAVDESGKLLGVAVCGRPVARYFDDGLTVEVTRTCTDGSPNVNSFLYGAAWRIAAAMGYASICTYTEESETGASLKAAGFERMAERAPRKNWADHSIKLRNLRDPYGRGGVARTLWVKGRWEQEWEFGTETTEDAHPQSHRG